MAESVDVVIVGARCAGAALAAQLAERGVRVAVFDAASTLGWTLSTHIVEADGLAFLDRLGVTERLRASGAPPVDRVDLRIDDLHRQLAWPQVADGVGGLMSVRRQVLDPILLEAAEEAGAQVRMASRVLEVLAEGGRVNAVRVQHEGRESELRARLVVGADGRTSTVARGVGARTYNTTTNQRALLWGYFEGAVPVGEVPTFLSHRWEDRFMIAIPTDAGLYQVCAWPEFGELARRHGDRDAVFADQVRACAPVAEALANARQVGKLTGATRWAGFFRQPAGPGWVLLGDAGHFKDPAPGRGISDAFAQADTLATAIVTGLAGSDRELDSATARWGCWRDRAFAEHYWLAGDLGQSGPVPKVLVELLVRLERQDGLGEFLDLLNHRRRPSQVLTPRRLAGATAGLLGNPAGSRGPMLREIATLGRREVIRRWRTSHPLFDPATSHKQPAVQACCAREV